MLIMRFHKLIQSKLLWLIFLGIVVTSFVALQVASDTRQDPALAGLRRTVARIDGEDVSFLRFDVTRRLISLQSPQQLPTEMLEEVTFNHMATVSYAKSMGIEVEKEFAAQQFAQNFTDENGQLNVEALERFRQGIRGNQISESDYIVFIQEQMIVDQLRRAMAGTILIPEFDVERWAALQTDEFVVQYAPLGPEVLTEQVVATEEQVAAFFAENAERFTLPEERKVRYLEFPVASAIEEISLPSVEEARAAYNANPDAYTRTIEVPAEEEGGEATSKQEPIPFEEVQEDLQQELREQRGRELAQSQAMKLAVRMTPRRGRNAETLDALAAEAGVEILTSDAFAPSTQIEGSLNAPAVKQAAFGLDESGLGQRVGPVDGGDAFYILELAEVIPPRVPELDEVKERAQLVANNVEQRKALATQAEVLAEAIRTQMQEGVLFEEAAKAKELNVLTSDPISLMTLDPRRSMIPNEIVRELPAHLPNELMGPVQSQFGGYFLASVKERTAQPLAKEEALEQTRQMLASQLQFQGMFSRFQEQTIQPMIEKL